MTVIDTLMSNIYSAVSDATGGIISDASTAIIAIIIITLACVGVAVLWDILVAPTIREREREAAEKEAMWYAEGSENASNRFQKDIAERGYKRALKRYERNL